MRGAGGHHGGSGARESLHLMQVSLNDCLCYGAAAAAGDVAATQGLVDRLHVLKEIMDTNLSNFDSGVQAAVLQQVLIGNLGNGMAAASQLEKVCNLLPTAAAADCSAGIVLLRMLCHAKGQASLSAMPISCLSTICAAIAALLHCCLEGKAHGTGQISAVIKHSSVAEGETFGFKGRCHCVCATNAVIGALRVAVGAALPHDIGGSTGSRFSPINNSVGSGYATAGHAHEAVQHAMVILDVVAKSGMVQALSAATAQPKPSTGNTQDEEQWEYCCNLASKGLKNLLYCAGPLKHVSLVDTEVGGAIGNTSAALASSIAPEPAAGMAGPAPEQAAADVQRPRRRTWVVPDAAADPPATVVPVMRGGLDAAASIPASPLLGHRHASGSEADDETTSMRSASSGQLRGMAISSSDASDFTDAADSALDPAEIAAPDPLSLDCSCEPASPCRPYGVALGRVDAAGMARAGINAAPKETMPQDLHVTISPAAGNSPLARGPPAPVVHRRGPGQLLSHALRRLSPRSSPRSSSGASPGQRTQDAAAIATASPPAIVAPAGSPLVNTPPYARALGTLQLDSTGSMAGRAGASASPGFTPSLLSPGSAYAGSLGPIAAPSSGPNSPMSGPYSPNSQASNGLLHNTVASQVLPLVINSKHIAPMTLNLFDLLLRFSYKGAQEMEYASEVEGIARLLETLVLSAPACVAALLLATYPGACKDLEVRALRLHTCPLSPSATDLPTGCAARALLWLEQVLADVRVRVVGRVGANLSAAVAAAQCRRVAAGPTRACLACGTDMGEEPPAMRRPMCMCMACQGELWCGDACRMLDGARHARVCMDMLQQA